MLENVFGEQFSKDSIGAIFPSGIYFFINLQIFTDTIIISAITFFLAVGKEVIRQISSQWKRAKRQLTWYLFTSVEGEPRYRSENAEAGRDQKHREVSVSLLPLCLHPTTTPAPRRVPQRDHPIPRLHGDEPL